MLIPVMGSIPSSFALRLLPVAPGRIRRKSFRRSTRVVGLSARVMNQPSEALTQMPTPRMVPSRPAISPSILQRTMARAPEAFAAIFVSASAESAWAAEGTAASTTASTIVHVFCMLYSFAPSGRLGFP